MSGAVPLGEVAKSVTPRFNLVGLIPSVLLAIDVGALIVSGSFSGVPRMNLLLMRSREVNVFDASLLFLVVLSIALVIHPFQLLLVRILEGYWDETPILRKLKYIGMEINRRRWAKFQRERNDEYQLARLYPESTRDFLPTRLGNVLRTAEWSAGKWHGFEEPVEMFPRVYPYASAALSGAVSSARDTLDIACRMSVVLWLLAFLDGTVFALDGAVPASNGAWLGIPVAAALLGWLSYRGAVRAAKAYGRFLFYVFDLHRQDLIRALGYEPPESLRGRARSVISSRQLLTGWCTVVRPRRNTGRLPGRIRRLSLRELRVAKERHGRGHNVGLLAAILIEHVGAERLPEPFYEGVMFMDVRVVRHRYPHGADQ